MNKEQIQQKFKDIATDRFHFYTNGDIIGSVNYKDLLDVLEHAFNLGLEVAADNAEADYNMVGSCDILKMGDIEVYVLKNSILKFKL